MTSRLTRPSILLVSLFALAMFATTCGVSGASNSEPEAAANVELTLAVFPGHGFGRLVSAWEHEHPGVTVNIVERTYPEHHEVLETVIRGEPDAPAADVAMVEVQFAVRFTNLAEGFVDLRDLGAEEIAEEYLDWRWNHGVAPGGEVIGIPTDVGGLAVAYRHDLFAAAGLPTDRDEVAALWPTWPDFITTGERFSKNSDVAFLDDVVRIFSGSLNQSEVQLYQDGEIVAGMNPAVAKSWEYTMDAIAAGVDLGTPTFTEGWNTAMKDGRYAVLLAPAWMMSYIQQEAPATEGLWDLAAIPGEGGNWGGSQLAIPASTEEPELAWDLINYLLGPRGQLHTFESFGNFPTITSLYSTDVITEATKAFFNDAPVGQIYGESVLQLKPVEIGEYEREILVAFDDHIRLIRDLGMEPAVGWRTSLDTIDELANQ